MPPTDRLFSLVQLLRARRFVTADVLAEELGVSRRTVYRDIAELVASGVPIRGEAGVGYHLHRGYELPPVTFNGEEIEALVLGARMVQAWGDTELAASARSALAKVGAVLPDPLRPRLDEAALFAPSFHVGPDTAARLGALRRAVSARRKVALRYQRSDGAVSERVVRPLGLYFWGDRWTLAAWCELRDDYRSFRPDRVVDLTPLEEVFDDADGVSLAAFLAQDRLGS